MSLLLERAGEWFTRNELQQRLWPADTCVDFDNGLNSAVAQVPAGCAPRFCDRPRSLKPWPRGGIDSLSGDATPRRCCAAPWCSPVSIEHGQRNIGGWRGWIAGVPLLAFLCTIDLGALYRKSAEGPLSSIEGGGCDRCGLRGSSYPASLRRQSRCVRNGCRAQYGTTRPLVWGETSLHLSNRPAIVAPLGARWA